MADDAAPLPFPASAPIDQQRLEQLLQRLSASAGRDVPFLNALIESLRSVLDGRYGAVFVTDGDQTPRIVATTGGADLRRIKVDPQRLAWLREHVERARQSIEPQVFDHAEQVGGRRVAWQLCCLPLVRGSQAEGVCIVLLDPQTDPRGHGRLAAAACLCGLYPGHVARRMLVRQGRQTAAMRAAIAVLACVQGAGRFEASAMNACNRLKRQLDADRVSLSWVGADEVRLVSMSDTEHVDRRQDLVQSIEAAMEECFDQGTPIVSPIPSGAGRREVLAGCVRRCHEALLHEQGGGAVCSVPLRDGDGIVGILTVEKPRPARFGARSITHLQTVAELLGPALAVRAREERPLRARAAETARAGAGRLIGRQHVGLKIAAVLGASLLLYACLATWPYRLQAPFRFQADAMRVYSAFFDATIEEVDARKGQHVKEGHVLARLDASRILIELQKVAAQLDEQKTIHLTAMRDGKTAAARRAEARGRRFEAEKKLLEHQSAHAALTAREDGVVISGDWLSRLGERVERGQALFEVAPLEKLHAVIYVDEADVDRVRPGSEGQLSTRGRAEQVIGFRVLRVVPLGEPYRGRNVFEVHAELAEHERWMLPGMEGTAKIDAGRAAPIWIMTHRLVDFLRLQMWW